jgi:hypothetical protein
VITVPGAIVSDPTSAFAVELSVSAADDAVPPSNPQITIAKTIRLITLLSSSRCGQILLNHGSSLSAVPAAPLN